MHQRRVREAIYFHFGGARTLASSSLPLKFLKPQPINSAPVSILTGAESLQLTA